MSAFVTPLPARVSAAGSVHAVTCSASRDGRPECSHAAARTRSNAQTADAGAARRVSFHLENRWLGDCSSIRVAAAPQLEPQGATPIVMIRKARAGRRLRLFREKIHLRKIDTYRTPGPLEVSDERLALLQEKMLKLQRIYRKTGTRGIIIFEGLHGAGIGDAIKTIVEPLDPRFYRVHKYDPLLEGMESAETPTSKAAAPGSGGRPGELFMRRFWEALPPPGTLAIFDGSWYSRVLEGRAYGLVSKKEWTRAYHEINGFERMLYDEGYRLGKIFLHVSFQEAADRMLAQLMEPRVSELVSERHVLALAKYSRYGRAAEDCIEATSTTVGRWNVLPAHDRRYARLRSLYIATRVLQRQLELDESGLELNARKLAIYSVVVERTNRRETAKYEIAAPGERGRPLRGRRGGLVDDFPGRKDGDEEEEEEEEGAEDELAGVLEAAEGGAEAGPAGAGFDFAALPEMLRPTDG